MNLCKNRVKTNMENSEQPIYGIFNARESVLFELNHLVNPEEHM